MEVHAVYLVWNWKFRIDEFGLEWVSVIMSSIDTFITYPRGKGVFGGHPVCNDLTSCSVSILPVPRHLQILQQ